MSAPESPTHWRILGRELALDRPLIAGVLNVTPDSFSDGGRFARPDDAIARARVMASEGAAIIDVGAESTRPGAGPVDAGAEWSRLAPVLEGIADLPVAISVDTMKLSVAEKAIKAGAAIINDVSGLSHDPRLAGLAAETGAGLVLMHMRGTPRTMQGDTRYDDVVAEVTRHLGAARSAAVEAGCDPGQVAVDPGIGFGKSLEGNLDLIGGLAELSSLGAPIWIGPSRKSFLGLLLGVAAEERLHGTIAACIVAARHGAHVFRVHDVEPVRMALEVAGAIEARAYMVGTG